MNITCHQAGNETHPVDHADQPVVRTRYAGAPRVLPRHFGDGDADALELLRLYTGDATVVWLRDCAPGDVVYAVALGYWERWTVVCSSGDTVFLRSGTTWRFARVVS